MRDERLWLTENPDTVEKFPAASERDGGLPLGVLQRKSRKGASVAAAPWFLARVVEGDERLESAQAGIGGAFVQSAALRTPVSHAVGAYADAALTRISES